MIYVAGLIVKGILVVTHNPEKTICFLEMRIL